MKMKLLYLTMWLLLIFSNKSLGQNEDLSKYPTPVIPSSPNASELGRYGNVPVSLFTGTISQSIPVENIAIGSYTLSISLSYNSGGIRVSQEASHTGLGWVLNAGGVVTRSVLGIPDEEYYLTPTAKQVPIGEMEPKDDFPYYLGLSGNVSYDAQPDMFYYNFDGKSGRFFFDQEKNPHLSKQDNIKISWVSANKFEIITENGNKYIFEDVEMSSNDSKVGNIYYFPSAWYLTRMELPNGTEIVSYAYNNYETFTKQYQSKTFTESYSMYSPQATNYWCVSDLPEDNGGIYITSIQAKILKEITFRTGKVEFQASGRLDHLTEKKIDRIIVSNSEGMIKEHSFQYGYFNDDATVLETDFKRLKLEKLTAKDKNSNTISQYEFLYEESVALPQKTSFAQDHWGYYNGKNNNPHLVPAYKYTYTDHTGAWPREKAGADRSADYNYMKAGILKQIKYPTGGYTNFTYGAHDIGGGTEMVYPEFPVTKSVITDIPNDIYTRELTFTLNRSSNAIITATFPSAEYLDQNGIKCNPAFSLLNVTQGTAVILIDNFSYTQETFLGSVTLESNNTYKIIVTETDSRCYNSATYTPYLESELKVMFTDINTSLPQVQVDIPKEKVGGLRIEKIETYTNSNGPAETRSFDYSTGYNLSSGKLTERPIYEYPFQIGIHNPSDPNDANPSCPAGLCSYLIRKSSSLIELGTVQGSHICYTRVTETFGATAGNGKIEYEYSFITDPGGANNAPGLYPFPPAASYDFYRGNLIKQTTYNKDNEIVRMLTNQYDSRILDTITALKAVKRFGGYEYQLCFNPAQFTNPVPFNDNFINPNYYLISGISRIKESADIIYSFSGNLETITKYEYHHDYLMPSKVETRSSNSETKIEYTHYFTDYQTGTAYIDYLRDKFILAPVEKVRMIKKSDQSLWVASGQYFKYAASAGWLPSEIYSTEFRTPLALANWKFSNRSIGLLPEAGVSGAFSPAGNYKKQAETGPYDNWGNIGQIKKEQDNPIAYQWSYNNALPIAEVTNALKKDIFHTSFEDTDGNSADGDSKTGRRSKTNGYTQSLTGITNGDYILSYWKKTSGVWSLQKTVVTVSGGSYSINLTGQVDEVRLYPSAAQMTTYTYEPLIGMTSQCDVNNRITYYEYDGFGRLKTIRDQDGNIIKTIDYQYQQPNHQ